MNASAIASDPHWRSHGNVFSPPRKWWVAGTKPLSKVLKARHVIVVSQDSDASDRHSANSTRRTGASSTMRSVRRESRPEFLASPVAEPRHVSSPPHKWWVAGTKHILKVPKARHVIAAIQNSDDTDRRSAVPTRRTSASSTMRSVPRESLFRYREFVVLEQDRN
jgi:hypothetical protein